MDFNKLTLKSQEAVAGAQELARRMGNPELYPEHLLLALLDQELPQQLVPDPADLRAQAGQRDAQLAQHAGNHRLVLPEQHVEQVLGGDLRVLARRGQRDGGLQRLLRLDGETVGVQGSKCSVDEISVVVTKILAPAHGASTPWRSGSPTT